MRQPILGAPGSSGTGRAIFCEATFAVAMLGGMALLALMDGRGEADHSTFIAVSHPGATWSKYLPDWLAPAAAEKQSVAPASGFKISLCWDAFDDGTELAPAGFTSCSNVTDQCATNPVVANGCRSTCAATSGLPCIAEQTTTAEAATTAFAFVPGDPATYVASSMTDLTPAPSPVAAAEQAAAPAAEVPPPPMEVPPPPIESPVEETPPPPVEEAEETPPPPVEAPPMDAPATDISWATDAPSGDVAPPPEAPAAVADALSPDEAAALAYVSPEEAAAKAEAAAAASEGTEPEEIAAAADTDSFVLPLPVPAGLDVASATDTALEVGEMATPDEIVSKEEDLDGDRANTAATLLAGLEDGKIGKFGSRGEQVVFQSDLEDVSKQEDADEVPPVRPHHLTTAERQAMYFAAEGVRASMK